MHVNINCLRYLIQAISKLIRNIVYCGPIIIFKLICYLVSLMGLEGPLRSTESLFACVVSQFAHYKWVRADHQFGKKQKQTIINIYQEESSVVANVWVWEMNNKKVNDPLQFQKLLYSVQCSVHYDTIIIPQRNAGITMIWLKRRKNRKFSYFLFNHEHALCCYNLHEYRPWIQEGLSDTPTNIAVQKQSLKRSCQWDYHRSVKKCLLIIFAIKKLIMT